MNLHKLFFALVVTTTTLSTFAFATEPIQAQQSVQECFRDLAARGVSPNQAAAACQNQTGDPLRIQNQNQGIDQSCVNRLMYKTARSVGQDTYQVYPSGRGAN
jgi:hypothetical protein